MPGAVWVHPGEKTVFPVAVEPIVRQDGEVKNNCELNAPKRLVPQMRQVMPEEKLLLTMDALLADNYISFLIGIKEGTLGKRPTGF